MKTILTRTLLYLVIGLYSTPETWADTYEHGSVKSAPTLARVYKPIASKTISGLCHILLYYGTGKTDLDGFPSGSLALDILTDESKAIAVFGSTPMIRTRNGMRYFLAKDPLSSSSFGEAHRDQCLATFAVLNLPLSYTIRMRSESLSLQHILAESIANFGMEQGELTWTAQAYTKYLPPKKEWINRFGQSTSFSDLANKLLSSNLMEQSCGGTHVVGALVEIYAAHLRHEILDVKTAARVKSFLIFIVEEARERQLSDGTWNFQWCAKNARTPLPSIYQQLLVTGHLLEVLLRIREVLPVPREPLVRAAEALPPLLEAPELEGAVSMLCPFTHASRAVTAVHNEKALERWK